MKTILKTSFFVISFLIVSLPAHAQKRSSLANWFIAPFHSLFSSGKSAGHVSCRQILSEPAPSTVTKVSDLSTFGQAMTEGMLLQSQHADLFEIYRGSFFGEATTSVNNHNLKSVLDLQAKHPELRKPHFREYEISQIEKVYETPESLAQYLKSQIQIAGAIRNNLLQIDANLGFWKKILDYEDPTMPVALVEMQKEMNRDSLPSEKENYRKAKSTFEIQSKKRFETYLNRVISKTNRNLLSNLKSDPSDYQKNVKALFLTLKYIQDWMEKKGRNTQAIRQALVDLVHTVGFGNQATQTLLKSKNAIEQIEGLKKILDERDSVSMDLTAEKQLHFRELQENLGIEFPTGFSKNEDPHKKIQDLEKEVLAGRYSAKTAETLRVRSLSIQEAPFRSCLGGSDCSTRTYFSKALDPNFNYFTMTDGKNHSSGHVTVVLGEARNSKTGKMEKVAFADKLQNVPNRLLPVFLEAVSRSLSEKGYKLGLPEDVSESNGLSNMPTTGHFVKTEILPKLSQIFTQFVPHENQFKFENGYSRAAEKLSVRIYELKNIDAQTEIKPGRSYLPFEASSDLNKNKLIEGFLSLKNSSDPNEVLKYVAGGQVVHQLERLGLHSLRDFKADLATIVGNQDLPFHVRKAAAFEIILLDMTAQSNHLRFETFSATERVQLASELRQWSKSSDKRRKKFAENLSDTWVQAINNSDIQTLETFVTLKLFDINTRFDGDFSSLQQAIFNDHVAVVEWLLTKTELDIHYRDKFGFSDVEYAKLLGKNEIINLIEKRRPELISRNFDINVWNADGSPIIDFVKVPAGTFNMGSMGTTKKVSITIEKPFEMMSTLTRQKVWTGIVTLANLYLPKGSGLDPAPFCVKCDDLPANKVPLAKIHVWLRVVNKLSISAEPQVQKALSELFPGHSQGHVYRLPTEGEWEYVARARSNSNREFEHPHPKHLENKIPIIINGKPIYEIYGSHMQWMGIWHDVYKTGGIDPQIASTESTFGYVRGGKESLSMKMTASNRFAFGASAERLDLGFRLVRTSPVEHKADER